MTQTSGALAFVGSKRLAILIVILAVVMQVMGHFNGDNAWFITFAERVLDGARAYTDIGDPNPPAGFLIYAPAVVLARLIGVRVEAAVVFEILVLVALCLLLINAIISHANLAGLTGFWRNSWDKGVLRNVALWILLVAPGFGFAEREHFALIACLPLITLYAIRGEGEFTQAWLALLAGFGGGCAGAIKPYYFLGIGAALLAAVCCRRSFSLLWRLENFVMAAIFILYLAVIQIVFPDFFTAMLPLALDVYAPARMTVLEIALTPPLIANLLLITVLAIVSLRIRSYGRIVVLTAASVGFFCTYIWQAKGWFNHAYPGLALSVLAMAVFWLAARGRAPDSMDRFARLGVAPALICAPFFAAVTMLAPGVEEYPGLTEAVHIVAPARPKIAALALQLDVGHPLVRNLGGVWVGRQNALWIHNCVARIFATHKLDPAQRAKLEAYDRADQVNFARDIADGRPDVLLVESPELREWALRQPSFEGMFDHYAKSGQVGPIEIWTRSVL